MQKNAIFSQSSLNTARDFSNTVQMYVKIYIAKIDIELDFAKFSEKMMFHLLLFLALNAKKCNLLSVRDQKIVEVFRNA